MDAGRERSLCALAGFRAAPLTHAHALVGRGLEAVVAGAAVAALRVDTVAVAAHVRDLLALVPIWEDKLQALTGIWGSPNTSAYVHPASLTESGLSDGLDPPTQAPLGDSLKPGEHSQR